MNTLPSDTSGKGGQRPPQPSDLKISGKDGRHPSQPVEIGVLPQPIEAGLDLSPADADLAGELIALSEATHPNEDFVTHLEGELTRQRLASRPRRAFAPSLAERLRAVLYTAWGWTLPAGALLLLILVISLLLQMRPRQSVPAGLITATQGTDAVRPYTGTSAQVTNTILPSTSTSEVITYVVQEGDTLSGIASYFGVTPDAIFESNHLKSGDILSVGLSLIIPRGMQAKSTPVSQYIVQEDDTLSGIASYFGVTVEALLEANHLQSGDSVRVGQSLIIPRGTQAKSTSGSQYIVQAGDTLISIADDLGVKIDALLEANHLTPDAALQVGQILIIPGGMQATITPIPPVTPNATAQALLAQLQSLVAKRRAALLNGPGWIYQDIHSHELSAGCGSLLPNGATLPCEYDTYTWAELNDRGQVVTEITRQVDPSGQVIQESVTQDGASRNLTFGTEETATLTDTYQTDWGFAANLAEALGRGAYLRQPSSSIDGKYNDQFILLVVEDNNEVEFVFDPQTGGLLAFSTWIQTAGGLEESSSQKILTEERVDQPPAEALALLDQPLTAYQPLPPQGTPVPAGFDLAYSTLSLRTIFGDSIENPSFFYGDIIADGTYLVGRVDFGATPGGWCQRSPDGLKLAFSRVTLHPGDSGSPTQAQLSWLDLTNPADVHAVLPDLQLVSLPVWGPDSARLAFTACDANQNCGLYTYDTSSGASQRLADGGNAVPPIWSLGGVEIAFRTGPSDALQTVVMDAASGMVIASPGWQPQFVDLKEGSTLNQCEVPPALAPALPAAAADWLTYTNADYGFIFRYPPDWTLDEQPGYIVLKQGTLQISIGFRGLKEPYTNRRTGVTTGNIVSSGHVSFFGQSLPRYGLVYKNKLKAVLYKMGSEADRGDLIFTLSLDDFNSDYGAVEIPQDVQQAVDQVIESFAWIPGPPPQTEPTATPTVGPFVLVVAAQQDWVPIYSGPGVEYPQVGEVANSVQITQTSPLGCNVDETWIAFQRPGYESQTTWIPATDVNLAGQVLREETASSLPVSTPVPGAPPDSMRIAGRIAFVSMRDGYPVLYAMNADGSGLTMLVNDLGGLMDPIWSPDGQTLSFNAISQQAHDMAQFTVDANGGPWYQVNPTNIGWNRSDLSPDGKRKVYIDTIQGGLTCAFVSAADGSNPVNLSGSDPNVGGSSNPVWSPDGSQITFIDWFFDKTSHVARIDLVAASADGAQRHVLVQGGVTPGWPSWSPDGQYIAYAADGDIDVVRLADAQAWRLTEDPADDYDPAWNPSTSLNPLPGERPSAPVTPAYTTGDEELARQELSAFLDDLHSGQYLQAEALYGGPYDVLVDNNWSLDPRDKVALLKNACEVNGYQCLQSNSSSLIARRLPDMYVFLVSFQNADGSQFVQGPCCGGSAADWTPVSRFEFVVVKRSEGQFVVLQLPPSVP